MVKNGVMKIDIVFGHKKSIDAPFIFCYPTLLLPIAPLINFYHIHLLLKNGEKCLLMGIFGN